MTNLQRLLDSGLQSDEFITFTYEDLEMKIKEYSEQYAKKCLYLADEEINAYNNIIHPTDLELPPHD